MVPPDIVIKLIHEVGSQCMSHVLLLSGSGSPSLNQKLITLSKETIKDTILCICTEKIQVLKD